MVPLYGRGTEYAVITFRQGNGRVFFMSCPYIFGASGLTFPANAAFLYNLMSTVPRKARIGLAEYRYNGTRAVHSSDPLIALLFETPGGLGILYLGVALFVFLMLRGAAVWQAVGSARNASATQFRIHPRDDSTLPEGEHKARGFETTPRWI